MPTYITVILVIDLLLLLLRALFVMMGLIGLLSGMARDAMVVDTGWYEVASGVLMVVAGLPANVAMLAQQRWGVWLAWAKVVGTLGSIGVGIWQLTYFAERYAVDSPEFAGVIIGAVLVVGWRLALVGIYCFAVVQFSIWAKQSEQQSATGPAPL
jgi:hypothetical protein